MARCDAVGDNAKSAVGIYQINDGHSTNKKDQRLARAAQMLQ